MLVKAQIKRIEDLPEWFLCCPAMRQACEKECADEIVHTAILEQTFPSEIECQWCHRITDNVLYRRCVGKTNRGHHYAIAVDGYEFDEATSPTSPTRQQ